ncbi:MAG: hypothetical protein MZW92_34290 [Comamonadaceae bacterium]|nr:hypothetical protein [Comamonadaceae bacterium]
MTPPSAGLAGGWPAIACGRGWARGCRRRRAGAGHRWRRRGAPSAVRGQRSPTPTASRSRLPQWRGQIAGGELLGDLVPALRRGNARPAGGPRRVSRSAASKSSGIGIDNAGKIARLPRPARD